MLDNNVNKNQQIAFQTMQPNVLQNPQVSMEAVNPELLKENVQDTYVGNRIAETTEDPKAMLYTAGLTVPLWFIMAQAMDKFAEKSRGDYENTIQAKIGNFGDKVSDGVKDSAFGKSNFAQGVIKKYNSFKTFLRTKIIDNSRLLRAFEYTPSKPELDMVIGQYEGMQGMQLYDYPQHGENFVQPLKHVEDLDCYGATKEEIEAFKTRYNAAAKDAQAKLLQEFEHDTLLKNSRDSAKATRFSALFKSGDAAKKAEVLRDWKAFEWGYKDFADMTASTAKSQANKAKILAATLNANPKMFSRIWGTNSSEAGKFCLKLFGREVYAKETANKLMAEYGNDLFKEEYKDVRNVLESKGLLDKLPKTAFGRWLNKYTHMTLEGATNRVAGGKFIAVMQAAYLADVVYKSMTAEGGVSEKAKSFAERFAEMLSFFICMPFALQLMHKIGGLQYAGLSKEQVEQYRKNLAFHNQKAMSGGFANEKEWKASRDALRKELKAGVKNPFVNLAKRIGRIVTVGLEQIRPYDKSTIGVMKDGKMVYRDGIGAKLKDLWHHPKFGMKQMAGYPMRIILGMFILLPIFNKIAVKTSHLIFGKPKKSLLDEGKETEQPNNQATNLPPQLQQNQTIQQANQQITQNVQPPITPVQYNMQGQSTTNLLNKYRTGQTAINGYQNTQNYNNNYQSTTTTTNIQNPQEPVRTYIPSPVGVKIVSGEDATAANEAMRRADLAEQKALETLKMN